MKKKILFTTPVLENPPAGGPQLRIENSIKSLNMISELYIISRVPQALLGGLSAERYYQNLCYRFLYAPSAFKNFKSIFFYRIKKLRKILFAKDKQYNFDVYCLERDADFILKYAKKNNIGIIWFGYGNISYDLIKKIREKDSKIKCICDTDSVWSRFILRELPYEKSIERYKKIEEAGKHKEKEEVELAKLCDVVTAVSFVDSLFYKKLINDSNRVKLFSNVIDIKNYDNKFEPPVNFKKPCLFLSGSFGPGSSMDKAARWFVDNVFPLVKKESKNIHFYIVGNRAEETLKDIVDDSIIIVGKVNSVLPYLQNCNVAIVPLMFESGTRFKIIEAGACGIPIVSTTLGAEGLSVTHGKDIFIADEKQAFADHILKILNDEKIASEIAQNLKKLIQSQYCLDKLAQEGEEIINFLSSY